MRTDLQLYQGDAAPAFHSNPRAALRQIRENHSEPAASALDKGHDEQQGDILQRNSKR
jgi:hypothetical protein